MLTEQEKKQIRKFCLLPVLVKAYLAVDLLIGFAWAFLVMINDIVCNGGFYTPALCVYLGIVVVYTIAYIICFFTLRIGMKKQGWRQIVEKANVKLSEKDYSAQIASAMRAKSTGHLLRMSDSINTNETRDAFDTAATVGSLAVVTQMTNEIGKNAKSVAAVFGVEIPKAQKYVVSIILLPILLLTAVYIPQFMSSKQRTETEIAVASKSVYALQTSLQQDCDHVSIDDPKEEYRESGYQVAGYLYEFKESHNSYVSVTVRNDGAISEVRYCIDIDIQADKEKNLEKVKSDLLKLNTMMNDSGVEAISDNLLEECALPEEFISQFKDISYYEDLSFQKDENISINYMTDSEEEYDEYSESYIYLVING